MEKNKTQELNQTELDLDALECVTGGAGSDGGSDGTVTASLGNSAYSVNVGGKTVKAHMSGKLRMNYVRIAPGYRVRVEGNRITYRYK